MNKGQLTQVMEDYLKTVFSLLREKGKVNTNDLARVLKVSPPTVTQMVKKLHDAKLVQYEPYKRLILTPAGEKIAIEIVRHHRLIEKYLHEALGVPWDKVHEEAERWEHVISEEVEKRMDEALNYPKRDPHGSPIPTEELEIDQEDLTLLSNLQEGDRGIVREVSDEDPGLLKYLSDMKLVLDTTFILEKREPYGGPIVISVEGAQLKVGKEAASQIWVKPIVSRATDS